MSLASGVDEISVDRAGVVDAFRVRAHRSGEVEGGQSSVRRALEALIIPAFIEVDPNDGFGIVHCLWIGV